MKTLAPRIRTADLRTARLPEKRADPELLTPEHRAWRTEVLGRAGYQCQDCGRTGCRLFADHVVERQDGGALHDPDNGRARCGSCHVKKTNKERAKRWGKGV
jgi:5-methylcytosine-specific restriction protein A